MDFGSSYNREEYIRFFRQLFGEEKFIKKDRPVNTHIPEKGYFKSIHTLGLVSDLDGLDEDLVIMEIEHSSSRDARVALTKELMKLLSNTEIEATYHTQALVIFTNNEDATYRLSLFTTTYDRTQGIKKILSNPRRQSFLLGPGEKTKTPEAQLKNQIKNFSDLIERFKVEVVRREFFDNYIDLFIRLYIALNDDIQFIEVLKKCNIDNVKFTKNLLGKVIFVYFLQKKGWLGVEKGMNWGSGNKNFMRWLWDNRDLITFERTENFYNDCLEHLFYDGLNSPARIHNDDYDLNFKCRIPYLNGGLFKSDYDFEKFRSNISNDIFSNNNKDGILDIFDLYNFTIDEDDLIDSEIAVDPEMLGKIFEKMISVSSENINEIVELYKTKGRIQIGKELNKKFGAFYTPREIVHYMTRESLIAYLGSGMKGKNEENDTIIRALFSSKDKHISASDFDKNNELTQISNLAKEVDILLRQVKIIDPAVGSGAFPMGILHEISTLRYYLHSEGFCTNHKNEDNECSEDLTEKGYISMYSIKRDTIKNSIHGVDIEPGAIDIARLRFWLSLVVDASEPEPLPNFEFKFVCANTLIPLEDEREQMHLEFEGPKGKRIETVREHMKSYYAAKTNSDKDKFKNLLEKYLGFGKNIAIDLFETKSLRTQQLETYRPFDTNHSAEFFDPSLMMGSSKFDIVIGNPPWEKWKAHDPVFFCKHYPNYRELSKEDQKIIREQALSNPDIRLAYSIWKDNFETTGNIFKREYILQGSGDLNLYKLMLEKAIRLSKNQVSFIIPGSITVDEGSTNMRKHLVDNQMLSKILGMSNKDELFEDVDNNQKFASLFLSIKGGQKNIDILGWVSKPDEINNSNLIRITNDFYTTFDDYCTFYLDRNHLNFEIINKLSASDSCSRIASLPFHFWTEYHGTNDASYFNDREGKIVLISGKCIDLYDVFSKRWLEKHGRSARFESTGFPKNDSYRSEYYVSEVPGRISLHHEKDDSNFRIVLQDITGTINNVRTVYTGLLPKKYLTNNSLHNLFLGNNDEENLFYYSILSSFVLDWQARLKVATHVSKFIIETFLVPVFDKVDKVNRDEIIRNTLSLISVNPDYSELTQKFYGIDFDEILVCDINERQKIKNKNDALIAKCFRLNETELKNILNGFPLVEDKIKEDVFMKYLQL